MFFNQFPCWTVVLHASHGKYDHIIYIIYIIYHIIYVITVPPKWTYALLSRNHAFFSKNQGRGGMKGRSELFRKFIRFGMRNRSLGNPVFALSPLDIDKCGEVCIWGSQAEPHLRIWKNSAPSCWASISFHCTHCPTHTKSSTAGFQRAVVELHGEALPRPGFQRALHCALEQLLAGADTRFTQDWRCSESPAAPRGHL